MILRRMLSLAVAAVCATLRATAAEPFDASAALERKGDALLLTVSFTVKEGHHLYADQIAVAAPPGVQLVPQLIPAAQRKHDALTGADADVYEQSVTFTYLAKNASADTLDLTVKYQGCSETMCFRPETKRFALRAGGTTATALAAKRRPVATQPVDWEGFQIAGRASGYLPPAELLAFLDRVEAGRGMEQDGLASSFERKGVWLSLVLILVGGLALNFTPCVLPMIPINIAIIGAGARAGSRRRGLALGAAYGLGIAAVYGVLGVVVVLTGAKFGTLNASAWFNLGIAALFLVMALAMFDVFSIDFTRFQKGGGVARTGWAQFPFAAFMGGVAALLAGACVAPVLISVLVLSADLFARGSRAGLLLPFVLGLGMALPWPIAGAGLSFLPKPGQWMQKVKYAFGILILLFAAWYGRLGYSLLHNRSAGGAPASQSQEAGWLTSLDEGLRIAKREQKPVFVDFWASWCKNCLKMEQTTFKDENVRKRLDAYVKVKYRAEDMNDPSIRPVLDRSGVLGLPTYVVLKPQ